nr:uroporphyrinogen decarboxylase [Propionimicrobium lymphophilum]
MTTSGLIKPVLLIRPDHNQNDAAALKNAGLSVLVDPYLVIHPSEDDAPARRLFETLKTAGEGDWLAITSPRTMPNWAQIVGQKLYDVLDSARVRGLKVAAVGQRSASGLNADVIGNRDGTALAEMMIAENETARALIPQSAIARKELGEVLESAGWQVDKAPVYETSVIAGEPISAGAVRCGNISSVLLRSPSAVEALCKLTGAGATKIKAFAVGPTTQAAAKEAGLDVVDVELGNATSVAKTIAAELKKPAFEFKGISDSDQLPAYHPMLTGLTSESALIRNYRGNRTARPAVWFMRQAGRSLPEYRALREGTDMLESCLDPELAAEITLQPVRRHGLDAAILFSDIVVPARLAGLPVHIEPGVGPVCDTPIRSAEDVAALKELTPEQVEPVSRAAQIAVSELNTTPLIGFAGAPFTVASYLIEGKPSRNLPLTRKMMSEDPETWHRLLDWVARCTVTFLREQAKAGASALQLFDSWAGRLAPHEYREFSKPHSAQVLKGVADLGLPRVHFGTQTRDLLVDMYEAGADVVGVSHDIGLDEASKLFDNSVPLQGNINPVLLAGSWPQLSAEAADVIERGKRAPGHVVNLGHGVDKDTDPRVLTRLVEFIHGRQS